jgi:hypothetical protein
MQTETVTTYTEEMDLLAGSCPDATFYQSRAWIESLIETFPRMKFRSLVARDAGSVAGFFPYFLIRRGPLLTAWSMPFGTYGGPVTPHKDCGRELRRAYASVLTGAGVVNAGWIDFHGRDVTPGWESVTTSTHVIDLSCGFDGLWTGTIERQRQKRFRRAGRLGVAVRPMETNDDLRRYYEIYCGRLKDWGEKTRYPMKLFAELLERGGDSVRLYVAEHEDRIVGGHFNFYWKNMVTAWNGVTTPDSNHLQPGTMLYIECLKSACEEGFELYNLGGSLGKQSLIDFKESLGGVPYGYNLYRRRSLLGKIAAFVRGAGGLRREG